MFALLMFVLIMPAVNWLMRGDYAKAEAEAKVIKAEALVRTVSVCVFLQQHQCV